MEFGTNGDGGGVCGGDDGGDDGDGGENDGDAAANDGGDANAEPDQSILPRLVRHGCWTQPREQRLPLPLQAPGSQPIPS